MRYPDRLLGLLLMVLGVSIITVAQGFTVGFLVDPVGPRALPFLVGALFAFGGGSLLLRPGPAPDDDPRDTASDGRLASTVTCTVVFLLYVGAIPLLGFLASTILATGGLARLFGGRWLPGLGVGLAFGLGLYGLFSLGFGLDLPVGVLFEGGP